MSGATKIEWTNATWSPVTGCTKVSAGCEHCYAERMAKRLAGRRGYPACNPFAVTLHPKRLDEPLHWHKPRRVFVCSMGDLFHSDVPDEFIDQVFAVMARRPQHTFQILTKRPERMLAYLCWIDSASGINRRDMLFAHYRDWPATAYPHPWPLPNVWLGVSVEDQATADERIPPLLNCPAALRFVSYEPALGPVDLGLSSATCTCCPRWPSRWVTVKQEVRPDFPVYLVPGKEEMVIAPGIFRANSNKHGALSVTTPAGPLGIKPSEFDALPGLDWVIAGGETGPGARPAHPGWFRSVRDQCAAAGVPFFFKQWGGVAGIGTNWAALLQHGRFDS